MQLTTGNRLVKQYREQKFATVGLVHGSLTLLF